MSADYAYPPRCGSSSTVCWNTFCTHVWSFQQRERDDGIRILTPQRVCAGPRRRDVVSDGSNIVPDDGSPSAARTVPGTRSCHPADPSQTHRRIRARSVIRSRLDTLSCPFGPYGLVFNSLIQLLILCKLSFILIFYVGVFYLVYFTLI